MSVVASLLSLVLFLAFASAGVQKILFTLATSRAASHLGFTKSAYRRIGAVETLGAIGVLVGLAATRSSATGIVNEVAAASLFVMMMIALTLHLRKGDAPKYFAPALTLGILALLELIFRVA